MRTPEGAWEPGPRFPSYLPCSRPGRPWAGDFGWLPSSAHVLRGPFGREGPAGVREAQQALAGLTSVA